MMMMMGYLMLKMESVGSEINCNEAVTLEF